MAIVNPSLIPGFDLNSTNSSAPSAGLQTDGYAFGDIPASSNHNYMFKQFYEYLNFLKDNGVSRWDAATTYKKQAMIARNEIIYLSKADGNISNDPTTSPTQWISFPDWVYAPLKTTSITNAGSKSTIAVSPYFGTVASLKDSHTYYIRIETGTIDFPANVEINISGLGALPATIYLPTLNTQTGHILAVQYIAEVGLERFVQAGKESIGLDQVDNTSDADKPVSDAQAVINASKQNTLGIMILKDVRASGTSGGASVAGVYTTRTLNTTSVNTITGASRSGNQFTLPAGTFIIKASATAYDSGNHKVKMYNITNLANAIIGTSERTSTAFLTTSRSFIEDVITITSAKTFDIRHWVESSNANGFGIPTSSGDSEVYATIEIIQIG